MGLMFADAHAHANPSSGLGARTVAEKFRSVGGWFIALVMLPPYHYGVSGFPGVESYRAAFDLHIRECGRAREAGLRVSCFIGLHPAEVDRILRSGVRGEKALALIDSVMDAIEKYCREGLVDGVGEVGRQHYKASPEAFALAEYAMLRAFEISRDTGCLVHLHLENSGAVTVATIDRLVSLTGARRELILFHHSSREVARLAEERGFFATIPGKYEALAAVLPTIPVGRLMVESDFIDDPRRPCVSSCPWDVVEAEKRLLREGVVDEERLYAVNVDNIVRFYGVEPP